MLTVVKIALRDDLEIRLKWSGKPRKVMEFEILESVASLPWHRPPEIVKVVLCCAAAGLRGPRPAPVGVGPAGEAPGHPGACGAGQPQGVRAGAGAVPAQPAHPDLEERPPLDKPVLPTALLPGAAGARQQHAAEHRLPRREYRE